MFASRYVRAFIVFALPAALASAAELTVLSVSPPANAVSAPNYAPIVVNFDRAVDPATLSGLSFNVFGRASGDVPGARTLSPDGKTVTFTPSRVYAAGELVTLMISHDLKALDGSPMRSAGYCAQFWVRTSPASGGLSVLMTLTTNQVGESSRPYGGLATDLNNDGWVDLATTNEDTNDLRNFLNKADGTGQFNPFLVPPMPLAGVPSPADSADFNHDGKVDLCVANTVGGKVSILLGNGDGTFQPQQVVTVSGTPSGIAAIDVNGDGHTDVVNCNRTGNNMSVMINNGAGVFGAASFFESGVAGERGLSAADMNGDGILDLVVGGYNDSKIIVNLGKGDGTFTPMTAQSAGGACWMVTAGDLNGDGHVDAVSAASYNNRFAIVLGDGQGNLSAPKLVTTDPYLIGVELGDVEGDGDFDLMTSAYDGDWELFVNDGAAAFAKLTEFPAPQSGSCSIWLDIDNDRDLDVVLVDELEDILRVMKNSGTKPCPADITGDGVVDQADLGEFLAAWGTCPGAIGYNPAAGALAGDACVSQEDLGALLAAYGQVCP